MDPKTPESQTPPQPNMEAMIQDLLSAQLTLDNNVSSTSQLLRFVLATVNQNLKVIRSQLEAIQDLALKIDELDRTSDKAP